jgi:hypothetical protein
MTLAAKSKGLAVCSLVITFCTGGLVQLVVAKLAPVPLFVSPNEIKICGNEFTPSNQLKSSYTTGRPTTSIHGFWAADTEDQGNPVSSVLNAAVNTSLTLTADSAQYVDSTFSYVISTNPWNAGRLINGVDYTNTMTVNPAKAPAGVVFSWSWPMAGSGSWGEVKAYPEINYFPHDASGNSTYAQVGNFTSLTSNYSVGISGDTGDFNVSFDLFLTDKPNGRNLHEIMVWVHSPTARMESNQPYTVTVPGLANATVNINNSGQWNFIGLESPVDVLSNTISLSDILKMLIWNSALTGQEYISNVQFGSEVQAGAGGLHINSFGVNWNAKAQLLGTPRNDTFVISKMGGNNVIGNGGVDIVVYSGPFSRYQIKSSGSEILITEDSDISTLDELRGITFIQFLDGTYNVAAAKFTSILPQ